MLDLNQEIKERYPLCSSQRIKAAFCYPNWYFASSIADFLDHKHKLEATPDKLFLMDRSTYLGAAAVGFHNCYSVQANTVSQDVLARISSLDFKLLLFQHSLGTISEEDRRDMQTLITRYHNAKISDPSGEVHLHSSYSIPPESRLDRVWILYYPSSGIVKLGNYFYNPPRSHQEVSTFSSLVSTLRPLSL